MLADLHTHSFYSFDGKPNASPDNIARAAIAAGLTHVAVTDHCDIDCELAGLYRPLDREKCFAELAAAKEALPAYTKEPKVESKPLTLGMDTDIGLTKTYDAGENQYIGTGKGLMGDVVTRVTMDGDAISAVEVIEQNETASIAAPALEQLPGKFVGCKTAADIDAIDTISGCTVTSNALKEAVKAALALVK